MSRSTRKGGRGLGRPSSVTNFRLNLHYPKIHSNFLVKVAVVGVVAAADAGAQLYSHENTEKRRVLYSSKMAVE